MRQYDYCTVEANCHEGLLQGIKTQGLEGWQLVSVVQYTGAYGRLRMVAFMQREIQPTSYRG